MLPIKLPFDGANNNPVPAFDGKSNLSQELIQALALICGIAGGQRKAIVCLDNGILPVASNELNAIYQIPASSDNFSSVLGDTPCTEIMLMGHPSNTDLIWVQVDIAAVSTGGFPLAKNDVVKFTVNNSNRIHFLIVKNTERLIVVTTR